MVSDTSWKQCFSYHPRMRGSCITHAWMIYTKSWKERAYPFPELVSELILFGARRTVVGSPATRGGSAPGHCGAFGIAIHPAYWPAKLGGRARRVHCPPEAHGLSSRWTLSIGSDTSTCAAVHSALVSPRRSRRAVRDVPDGIRAPQLLQRPTC